MGDMTFIDRSPANEDLPARIGALGVHAPRWEVVDCPSCGSAPCGPHPDVLACGECSDDWPCNVAANVAEELDRQASDLERRSDNVPMGREGHGVERVGTLRDVASRLRDRASLLRGESGVQ